MFGWRFTPGSPGACRRAYLGHVRGVLFYRLQGLMGSSNMVLPPGIPVNCDLSPAAAAQHKEALEASLQNLRDENARNTRDVQNLRRREQLLEQASLFGVVCIGTAASRAAVPSCWGWWVHSLICQLSCGAQQPAGSSGPPIFSPSGCSSA